MCAGGMSAVEEDPAPAALAGTTHQQNHDGRKALHY